MNEYSRIIIEGYCMEHPNTKKGKFLYRMVQMSYDLTAEGTDADAIQLEKYIQSEKNPRLREALDDLDEFLFRL